MKFATDIPSDMFERILNLPGCPSWKGRRRFFRQLIIDLVNSPEFRAKELERDKLRAEREADRRTKEAERNACLAEYWRQQAQRGSKGNGGGTPELTSSPWNRRGRSAKPN